MRKYKNCEDINMALLRTDNFFVNGFIRLIPTETR